MLASLTPIPRISASPIASIEHVDPVDPDGRRRTRLGHLEAGDRLVEVGERPLHREAEHTGGRRSAVDPGGVTDEVDVHRPPASFTTRPVENPRANALSRKAHRKVQPSASRSRPMNTPTPLGRSGSFRDRDRLDGLPNLRVHVPHLLAFHDVPPGDLMMSGAGGLVRPGPSDPGRMGSITGTGGYSSTVPGWWYVGPGRRRPRRAWRPRADRMDET